jgi:hypothetical protein
VAKVADSVPELVIGEPVTEKIPGSEMATLVTVPVYVSLVKYPCDLTNAVVATLVELSELDWVVAVAEPKEVVPENVTVPENVYVPAAVCVRLLDKPRKAPTPPMSMILVAEPEAPPVPVPYTSIWLPSMKASSALAKLAGRLDVVVRLIRMVLGMVS